MGTLPNGEEVKWSALNRRAKREARALRKEERKTNPRDFNFGKWVFDEKNVAKGMSRLFLSILAAMALLFVVIFILSLLPAWIDLVLAAIPMFVWARWAIK